MLEEEKEMIELSKLKIKGEGFAEDMLDSSERERVDQGSVSYGAPNFDSELDPMEEFAAELNSENPNEADAAPVIIDKEPSLDRDGNIVTREVISNKPDENGMLDGKQVVLEIETNDIITINDAVDDNQIPDIINVSINPETIIEVPEGELPEINKSKKAPFDPNEGQSPLISKEREGGIVASKSTGPTMTQRNPQTKSFNPNPDGGQIKPAPDMSSDSKENKFEVSGFTVEYEVSKDRLTTVQIRDYFLDLETAFASINGLKYLMPMPSGYKISTINSGAPTICFNERQLYIYKNNKWNRT